MPETKEKILVVGGDSHFSYLIRRYSKMIDHPVVLASWAEDILALAKSTQPVVILLQVDHQGSAGWQLLHLLKSSQLTVGIPVVICSWLEAEGESKQEGADGCLRMPILFDDFTTELVRLGIETKTVTES
jgi:CheY-like chemotaxis protein